MIDRGIIQFSLFLVGVRKERIRLLFRISLNIITTKANNTKQAATTAYGDICLAYYKDEKLKDNVV